jgi:uncharacterized membrane protein
MNQPFDGADRADNRGVDQGGVTAPPRQPGTPTPEPSARQLWTLFEVDQQRISALDTIAMTIRGWTVTLVAAIVGFSLSQHHRNLVVVAMVGAVLFGLLDIEYRRTQLVHADRIDKVEQEIAQNYRFRSDKSSGRPTWLKRIWSRYGESISFYVVMLILLLVLWAVS